MKKFRNIIKSKISDYSDRKFINKLLLDVADENKELYKILINNQLQYFNGVVLDSSKYLERGTKQSIKQTYIEIVKLSLDKLAALFKVVTVYPITSSLARLHTMRDLKQPVAHYANLADVPTGIKFTAGHPLEIVVHILNAHVRHPFMLLPTSMNKEQEVNKDRADIIQMAVSALTGYVTEEIMRRLIVAGNKSSITVKRGETTIMAGIEAQATASGDKVDSKDNFIITSPPGITHLTVELSQSSKYAFKEITPTKHIEFSHAGNIICVSTGEIAYRVYTTIISDTFNDSFIVGNKGKSLIKCGLIYAPFLMIMPLDAKWNAIPLACRHDIYEIKEDDKYTNDISDFYKTVEYEWFQPSITT